MTSQLPTSFLPYAKQVISPEDVEAVTTALRSEIITRGPKVAEFEAALAAYVGARYAVCFNSGSTALRAAAFAADVQGGDRYITTPNSFVTTAVAGAAAGASPVFIDIDAATGNIDLDLLSPNLENTPSRGRNIVVPVHYAGVPVDMCRMDTLIRDVHTVVIEDGAAALGSSYASGHRVGSCEWSHMTVFSFHPAKIITTGEGGAVTTNDADLDRRLRLFRNSGLERDPTRLSQNLGPWYYEVDAMASNYNFTDFQAALGLSQLSRIESFIQARQQVIAWYSHCLANNQKIKLLTGLRDDLVAPQLAVVAIDFEACGKSRAEVMTRLYEKGIGSQVHYIPIYGQPIFQRISGVLSDYFPAAERFYQQALTLPLYVGLMEEDVKRICKVLEEILESRN